MSDFENALRQSLEERVARLPADPAVLVKLVEQRHLLELLAWDNCPEWVALCRAISSQSAPPEALASYDQSALDAASREVHMMLLREGSSWGTKACEEMGRVFMTAYLKALPSPLVAPVEKK